MLLLIHVETKAFEKRHLTLANAKKKGSWYVCVYNKNEVFVLYDMFVSAEYVQVGT